MNPLSPSAQKVQDILFGLGTNSKVIEFTGSTRTAQEAADRVGCQLGQIVKSMIFQAQASNHLSLSSTPIFSNFERRT
jgi:prolyl-tRNA editing enzyme YbaK/EbsC (Cys-tRNA(Pro) deacylase)